MAFRTRTRTSFGTLNVNTLLQTTRLAVVCREFRRYKLEILGLSEVRWKGSGERRAATGEFLLYSGHESQSERGVGLLLTAKAKKSLLSWDPVSDRILTARLSASPRNVTMVQVYAPTNPSTDEVKAAFYDSLSHTLDLTPRGDVVILLGDMNAKVGSDNSGWEAVMGRYGIGQMNENGLLFAELCSHHDLVIGGTLFPHKEHHKYTWEHPDPNNAARNQIDHIAISRRWKTSLEDVRNKRGADVASDHELLVGYVRLKMFPRRRDPAACTARRLNTDRLEDDATKRRFKEEMQERFDAIGADLAAEPRWSAIHNAYSTVGSNVLGFKTYERKEWISDDTWQLIMDRRALKSQKLTAVGEEEKRRAMEAYSAKERDVKRSARRDKRRWFGQLAAAAQQAADSHNPRETYRIAKVLMGSCKAPNHLVRAADGALLSNEEHQTERWSEHFEEVLNKPPSTFPRSPIGATPEDARFTITAPSQREIAAAIKKLKNNKAPGADNIASEMLKVDTATLSSQLQLILQEVWVTETIPTEWKDGRIVKLPKKGNLTQCTNWRGITLLNTVNKVVSAILYNRLCTVLEPKFRREQAGFRPGRSCTDHINTLRVIVEQSNEWQAPVVLLFVDFERAFDSLDRNVMFDVLASFGIPPKLLGIIRSMYQGANCRVIHRGELGREFQVASGVKQGCILSPLLFLLVLDWVMTRVNNSQRGIAWQHLSGSRLEDLDFADDICLFASTRNAMEEKLKRLIHYGQQVGLRVNVGKSKLMRLNLPGSFQPLRIGDEDIEEVESFCYLGCIIANDGGAKMCVDNRILKARQAFGMLKRVWASPMMSRDLKLRFFWSNVMSVLLYGGETWKTTPSIVASLQTFVNRCLRRILNIRLTDRVSNDVLWQRTRFERVELTVLRRKWRWIGHTLRKSNDIAKEALDWNPQGRRRRGRPKDTWKRSLDRELTAADTTWLQVKTLAPNRIRWRGFVDALCASMA